MLVMSSGGNMMASAVIFLLSSGALLGVVQSEDCLVGDIMYRPGDSIGYFGYSCTNGTHFEGSESFCGNDGKLFTQDVVLSCSGTVPLCVQCGTPEKGSALCLGTSEVPDYCDDSYVGPPRPKVDEKEAATSTDSMPNGVSGCLVGDIMYQPGDSIGVRGYACINQTYFDGSEGFCGEDGEIVRKDVVLSCSGTVPFCVQCGTPQEGEALCLSTSDVPDYCDDSYVGPPRPDNGEEKEDIEGGPTLVESPSSSSPSSRHDFPMFSTAGMAVMAATSWLLLIN